MQNCNGNPINPTEVARTKLDLQIVFSKAQADGLWPKESKVIFDWGKQGTAGFNRFTNNLDVDPTELSCLTSQELTAVILHESGHRNDPLMWAPYGQIAIQGLIVTAIVGTLAFRGVKLAFRAFGKPTKKWRPIIGPLFAGHTINAALIAGLVYHSEYRADDYAASYMGTGQPLASALTKMKATNAKYTEGIKDIYRDEPTLRIILKGVFFNIMLRPYGLFDAFHPDPDKRIQSLKSDKYSNETFPIGMSHPSRAVMDTSGLLTGLDR